MKPGTKVLWQGRRATVLGHHPVGFAATIRVFDPPEDGLTKYGRPWSMCEDVDVLWLTDLTIVPPDHSSTRFTGDAGLDGVRAAEKRITDLSHALLEILTLTADVAIQTDDLGNMHVIQRMYLDAIAARARKALERTS